jgi:aspartokinase-like uncharacterized kinase
MIPIQWAVVKVGGSLFDQPALGAGLRKWIAERPPFGFMFVPGGGPMADVIRDYHRMQKVDEETCHWMAIRVMGINTDLIKSMLPGCAEIQHPHHRTKSRQWVLNAHHFMRADASLGALPHNWRVTSDSIAARAAEVGGEKGLILLKSIDLPEGISWREAGEQGLVDAMFSEVVERAGLNVVWVNFRTYLDQLTAEESRP